MATDVSTGLLKEAVRLGQLSAETKQVGNTPFVVIPNDCKVVPLRDYIVNSDADRPVHKRGTVSVLDAASFNEYYSLFSDSHSRVFADETRSCVVAVLDYHGVGDNAPRWCQHRVRLDLRTSEEWSAWIGRNGQAKRMSQMEFAEFIEDNTPDIVTPNAATMLEMARTLQAKTDVDFSSAIRLNNGQVQLKYSETVKGTYGAGNVEIPEEFTISIPVYVGTPRTSIRARLRYRLNGGKLGIWYDLLRVLEVERNAFMQILSDIKEGLQISIINGSPE